MSNISFNNPNYNEFRFITFEKYFILQRDPNEKIESTREHFINAFRLLIDGKNNLIPINDHYKKIVLNGFLFNAAGIAKDSDKVPTLTDVMQLVLLKEIFLREIVLYLPTSSQNKFFDDAYQNLKGNINSLPLISKFDDLTKDYINDVNGCWGSLVRLMHDMNPLQENHQLFVIYIALLVKSLVPSAENVSTNIVDMLNQTRPKQ